MPASEPSCLAAAYHGAMDGGRLLVGANIDRVTRRIDPVCDPLLKQKVHKNKPSHNVGTA